MLETIKPAEAKKALTAILHKVAYTHRPIVFESRGKPIAAVISMESLEMLQKMLEEMEDEEDWSDMQAALKDPRNARRIPWEEVKHALDLQGGGARKRRKADRSARKARPNGRTRGH